MQMYNNKMDAMECVFNVNLMQFGTKFNSHCFAVSCRSFQNTFFSCLFVRQFDDWFYWILPMLFTKIN